MDLSLSLSGVPLLRSVGRFCIELCFPRHCISCEKFGSFLCQQCRDEIDYLFLETELSVKNESIDAFHAVARHSGVIRTLVHQIKYAGYFSLTETAGELLYKAGEWPDATDIVTSVPLHQKRQHERGFNQAELMAKTFCRLARLPYAPLVVRVRNSAHQADQKTIEDRLKNIGNDFALNHSYTRLLTGKHVLIIDDVSTTGRTLMQCAATLKAGGCATVAALTLAHGR